MSRRPSVRFILNETEYAALVRLAIAFKVPVAELVHTIVAKAIASEVERLDNERDDRAKVSVATKPVGP